VTQLPDPIPYASSASTQAVDAGHLSAVSICHYVWGVLVMAFSSIFIIHVVMGLMIARGAVPFSPAPMPAPTGATSQAAIVTPPAPPPALGYLMAGMGGCAVFVGWTLGILTIVSGRLISLRRRRTFSLVVAGINCASFPFGTVLGVFTFIVLARPSVRALYPPRGA
jgi:hypothetical protein